MRGWAENTARNLSSCVAMEGGARRRVRGVSTGFDGGGAMKTSESFVSMLTNEGAIVSDFALFWGEDGEENRGKEKWCKVRGGDISRVTDKR